MTDKYMHVLKEDLPHVTNLLGWDEKRESFTHDTRAITWHLNPCGNNWIINVGGTELHFADLHCAIAWCDTTNQERKKE